jgi:polyisoprenoid-binding protein YceI
MTARVHGLCALAALLALSAGGARLEAQPQTYVVDPGRSRVRIHLGRAGLVKFLGHDHEVDAPVADGRVEAVEGDPTRSTVALRFESARLAIVPGSEPAGDIPAVEERMRGPEVLDVGRYPEIAFASRSVRIVATEDDRFRLVVSGSLTLRGRPVPVEVPVEVTRVADGGLEARGETSLELKDLGIAPPSVGGVVKVANRFRVEFDVRATLAGASTPGVVPGRRARGAGRWRRPDKGTARRGQLRRPEVGVALADGVGDLAHRQAENPAGYSQESRTAQDPGESTSELGVRDRLRRQHVHRAGQLRVVPFARAAVKEPSRAVDAALEARLEDVVPSASGRASRRGRARPPGGSPG